jgi:hypothetical protein
MVGLFASNEPRFSVGFVSQEVSSLVFCSAILALLGLSLIKRGYHMKKRTLMTLVLLPFLASCGEEVDLYERGSAIAYALENVIAYNPVNSNVIFRIDQLHYVWENTDNDGTFTSSVDFSSKGYFHLGEVRKETQSDSSVKTEQRDVYLVIIEGKYYQLSHDYNGSSYVSLYSDPKTFFTQVGFAIRSLNGLAASMRILSYYLSSLRPGKEASLPSSSSLTPGKLESIFNNAASKGSGNLSFEGQQTSVGSNYHVASTFKVSFDNYLPLSFSQSSTTENNYSLPTTLVTMSSHTNQVTCTFDWSRYEEVIPALSEFPTSSQA